MILRGFVDTSLLYVLKDAKTNKLCYNLFFGDYTMKKLLTLALLLVSFSLLSSEDTTKFYTVRNYIFPNLNTQDIYNFCLEWICEEQANDIELKACNDESAKLFFYTFYKSQESNDDKIDILVELIIEGNNIEINFNSEIDNQYSISNQEIEFNMYCSLFSKKLYNKIFMGSL